MVTDTHELPVKRARATGAEGESASAAVPQRGRVVAPGRRPRALFICGSINQTTQMHAIARELPDWDASFTPFYGDFFVDLLRRWRLAEMSIGGEKRRRWCLEYLRDNGLAVDLHGKSGGYDVVVHCSDVVVPRNVRGRPLVLVQEGIVDWPGIWARVWEHAKWLPLWAAGTALTGRSGMFDRFCVASPGYRDFFVERGVDPKRIVVTGIPNFDDCARYLRNDFPHRGYLLVCTSDARETWRRDDRVGLVRRAVALAQGRQLVFKLHPNENHARASAEIRAIVPTALVYAKGSAEHMIANADVVMTQWSSTVFVAAALGKEVHSDVPLDEVRRLMPVQNGGRSARNIARVCRDLLASRQATPIVGAASLRRGEPDVEASSQALQASQAVSGGGRRAGTSA
jgi:hypothetical protein